MVVTRGKIIEHPKVKKVEEIEKNWISSYKKEEDHFISQKVIYAKMTYITFFLLSYILSISL